MSQATEFHIDVDACVKDMTENLKVGEGATKAEFRKVVRISLSKARKSVMNDAKTVMLSDPRKAYKAVKMSVYKRNALGGNIAIMEPRGKVYTSNYQKPRHPLPHKGGNRAKRSERTIQVDSYYGQSRAFILRFINSGTIARTAGSRTGKYVGANRGALTKNKGWFEQSGNKNAEIAAGEIGNGVAELVINKFNSK